METPEEDVVLTIKEFKRLCDHTNADVRSMTLSQLYQKFGLDSQNGMKREEVVRFLRNVIRSNLPVNLSPISHSFRDMKHGLILSHVIDGQQLLPYFPIALAIHDSARPGASSSETSEEPAWEKVVEMGRCLADVCSTTFSLPEETTRRLYSRAYTVGEAAKRLRERGYVLSCENGFVDLAESEKQLIAADIESLIELIGGRECTRRLVNVVATQYDEEMQRFHVGRRVDAMGLNVKADLPFGYLLNLAAKCIGPRSCSEDVEDTWQNLLTLATDFAAIHNLQPHSIWDLEYKDTYTLVEYLRQLALYDSFFCIRQIRPRDLTIVLHGLFHWVNVDHESSLGWRVVDAISMAKAIVDSVPTKSGAVEVKLDAIVATLPEQSRSSAQIIFSTLCHDHSTVNCGFQLPSSKPFPNLLFRPLIGCNEDTAVILSLPVAVSGFYESIAMSLRDVDRNTDDKIGVAAERLLEQQLVDHGVTTIRGKYHHAGIDGECDFVIETPDVVIFLEMKKKALTRAAQAGSDLDIFIDVAGSLFDASIQANGHEFLLRRVGELLLTSDDGSQNRLVLGKRRVEKVAITLLDYGALQDRTVLFQILQTTIGGQYAAFGSELHSKKIESLNDRAVKLNDQIKLLCEFENQYHQHPFFNCWHLSLPQLLVLLDRVTSNEAFWRELSSTRHVSMHTLDWYTEYAEAKRRQMRT